MTQRFEEKVAVLFGAARGIGAAAARAFYDLGAAVVVCDVLEREGRETVESLGSEFCRFVRCDVGAAADIDAAYDEAVSAFGGVDIVFNNVGIARYGNVESLSLADWDHTIRVNLTAQFLSCQRALAEMKKRGGGVIVNTASILGHASQKTTAAYAASKAGVMSLTRTIAIEYAKDNIRCVSISPGTIDTPLVQLAAETFKDRRPDELIKEWAAFHPLDRLGRAEEVAAVVIFLASAGAGFITGSDILIDGGIRAELYA